MCIRLSINECRNILEVSIEKMVVDGIIASFSLLSIPPQKSRARRAKEWMWCQFLLTTDTVVYYLLYIRCAILEGKRKRKPN